MMLARTLGRTLAELEATMTAQEFGDWLAEYKRHPWGDYAADLRAGVIASVIANVNRSNDVAAYKPSDFMPLQHTEQQDEVIEDDPKQFFKQIK